MLRGIRACGRILGNINVLVPEIFYKPMFIFLTINCHDPSLVLAFPSQLTPQKKHQQTSDYHARGDKQQPEYIPVPGKAENLFL
jgi:hypothetical protein